MKSANIIQDGIEALKRENELLKDEFDKFIYSISHDFSAPLRAVVNFSKLVKDGYEHALDDKGKYYLAFVVNGGEKAQSMLRGLLQYSRLHTRVHAFEPTEVSELIRRCQEALKEKIHTCAADIIIKDPLPVITADGDQIYQMFQALIDNALTYRKPDVSPCIHIFSEEQETYWKFYVEDNGIGITEGNRERIFELFRRLHTEEEYSGIGLGLAMARRITESHGGTIGVEPSSGSGSRFWFTIAKQESDVVVLEKSFG